MLRIVVVCVLVLRCHVTVADASAIRCRAPFGPKNGRVIYSSFDQGAELEYECDEGFMLQNHQTRICSEDGTWSNDEPECIEIGSIMPVAPEHGSVQRSEKMPKVLDTCKEEPPLLNNGKTREFAPVNGSVVDYECDEGYQLEGDSSVHCAFGTWIGKPPVCNPLVCNGEPPLIENGSPVIERREHGHVIWYKCDPGYKRVKGGRVICQYGKWEGEASVCGDYRCQMKELNFPGLVKPQMDFLHHTNYFSLACEKGYKVISWKKSVTCLGGKWDITKDPCILKTCEQEPPFIDNGKPRAFARVNGSVVDYECENGYELDGHSSIHCAFGAWIGQPPVCNPSRCYLKNLKNLAYVDVTATNSATLSGNKLVVICKQGYSPRSDQPVCLSGKWSINFLSPCTENDCVIPALHHGDIKELKTGDFFWNWKNQRYERQTKYVKIPVGTLKWHGSTVMVYCHTHCSFQGTSARNQLITCSKGRWLPDPVCLTDIPGCQVNKDETSHLIVDPKKDYYGFGEFILVSCPPGKTLTNKVEKIMCLGRTWSDKLPDCADITESNIS